MNSDLISYWAFFGTIHLFITTIELFRKKEIIDSRKQYFMMGVTIALYTQMHHSWQWLLIVLVATMILNVILNIKKNLFQADINAIIWVFTGIAIINMFYLTWFFIIFLTLCAATLLIKNLIFKKEQKQIYLFPYIFISFVIFCLTLGLY